MSSAAKFAFLQKILALIFEGYLTEIINVVKSRKLENLEN
jgi:hypothetical protein